MAALTTGSLSIPDQIFTPWLGKVKYGSAVAALSPNIPMKFGEGSSTTWDIGEAEYVPEAGNKGGSTITSNTVPIKKFKFHKTVRWTDEVKWADEDHQLGVISQILDLIQPSLSRALDYGTFHGINPATGAVEADMTQKLSDTTNAVEIVAGDKPYANLDAADALVLANDTLPSDAALAPTFASQFAGLRTTEGVKLYPDFQLSGAVSQLDGHRSVTSKTVEALGVATAATNVKGFVGDFSAIQWGIQKQMGLEMIEYGDPDGGGDLKRNNQVAFRAEIVYGWGIADLKAFAKIVDAVA